MHWDGLKSSGARAYSNAHQSGETRGTTSRCTNGDMAREERGVEAINEELKSTPGEKYGGPQCHLWTEAIDVSSNVNMSLFLVPSSTAVGRAVIHPYVCM